MAALSLAALKSYLRVIGNADDNEITAQMAAATAYIMGKISKTQVRTGIVEDEPTYGPIADDLLFQQCIKLLVAHWYENRGVVVTGTIVAGIPHTVDAITAHIEGCSDYK